jgi:hypothetical protein
MASYSLGALIEIEPSSSRVESHTAPCAPAKALPRVYHSVPDPIELDSIKWGTTANEPTNSGAATPSEYQTPVDLEMSIPGTPNNEEQDGVDAMQSFSNPPMNRYRMLCACLMNFGNGLNDSAPGALIPYIEKCVLSSSNAGGYELMDTTTGTITLVTLSCHLSS